MFVQFWASHELPRTFSSLMLSTAAVGEEGRRWGLETLHVDLGTPKGVMFLEHLALRPMHIFGTLHLAEVFFCPFDMMRQMSY